MAIAHYNIDIDKGTDSSITLALKNSSGTAISLTGYTAKMYVKPGLDSDKVIDVLTTENGRITIVGASGTITLNFTHNATSEYPVVDLVYDIIMIKTENSVTTYKKMIEGRIIVSETVTDV